MSSAVRQEALVKVIYTELVLADLDLAAALSGMRCEVGLSGTSAES